MNNNRTGIHLVKGARRISVMSSESKPYIVWLRYTPRICGGDVYNVDLDTATSITIGGKEVGQ